MALVTVVAVVTPVIVKLEVVPHVANGIGTAPVVAPVELQFEPFAKDKVATEPTKELTVLPKLIIPVEATVTKVLVPPVVVKRLEVLPAKFNVPAIFPVLPVPVNAKDMAFVAFVKFKVLPASTAKSSPPPPVRVITLEVVTLEDNVKAVELVTRKAPIEKLAKSTLIETAAPGIVPAPSTIKTSVVSGVVL